MYRTAPHGYVGVRDAAAVEARGQAPHHRRDCDHVAERCLDAAPHPRPGEQQSAHVSWFGWAGMLLVIPALLGRAKPAAAGVCGQPGRAGGQGLGVADDDGRAHTAVRA